jgi:hypothetical protein
MLDDEKFYALWEKFASSKISKELPDDVEEFCEAMEITVDYFIMEFI